MHLIPVRVGQLVQLALKVILVRLDRKENKARQAHKVIRAYKEFLGQPVRKAIRVYKVPLVHKVIRVFKAQLAHKVIKAYKEFLG
jgi:hypothetical protein